MTLNDADPNRWQHRLRMPWTSPVAPLAGARPRRPGPKAVWGAVLVALLVVTGMTASLGPRPVAEDTGLSGVPVPASHVEAISQAALSCPTLDGPRLAAQVMAASGFDVNARGAGDRVGMAALTDELWRRWIPWSDAPRMDPVANITALAHHMCDLAGELRVAGLRGDLWPVALAAHQVGLPEVREAKAVPPTATSYVDAVTRYAVWYGRQPEFRPDARPSPAREAPAVPTKPRPVPGEYVAAVIAAGRICPAVTAPRVAAQLMAASGFNPNMLGANSGQGIAQFRPELWERYGAIGQSPWDPTAAIPTLGRAMCGLSGELAGLAADPYLVALAAFHWGPTALRQAGGVPDAPFLREFSSRVRSYAAYYGKDPRFGAPRPSGPPSSRATTARGHRPTTAGTPAMTTPVTPPTTTAVTPRATTAAPSPAGFMIRGYGGRCVTVPSGTAQEGVQLRIHDCTGRASQRWVPGPDGSLRSLGMCMDLAWASSEDGTKVQLARCNGGWAQRFALNAAHDLVNTATGKCVDVRDWNRANGAVLQLWQCTGAENQKWFKR